MNLLVNISEGLRSISANLLRSILTALIIAIGITSLVGILTAIDSMKAFLPDHIAQNVPKLKGILMLKQLLEEMMSNGRFRKDLFYRLNVIPLQIPPLRERRNDIIPLARHFMHQITQEAVLPEINIGAEAKKALMRHDWPGNVRELLNVLERTLSSIETDTIRLVDLPFYLNRAQKKPPQKNPTKKGGVH